MEPINDTMLLLKIMASMYSNTAAMIVLGMPKVMIPSRCPFHMTAPYRSGCAHGISGPSRLPSDTPSRGTTAMVTAPINFPK